MTETTTPIPGKLRLGTGGRVTGPIAMTYNDPWPCVNGMPGGGSPSMMGVVMHTEVGNEPGTLARFNDPQEEASAFFSIGQDGVVHQYGPVGENWMAWAQEAGNAAWYSIEHADDGNPDNPLTDAQIRASAQLVEFLSAFARFPLEVTDSIHTRGYGTHSMGAAAWGGHTCPDQPPQHVRSAQRQRIIDLAWQIRDPQPVTPPHADRLAEIADHARQIITLASQPEPASIAEPEPEAESWAPIPAEPVPALPAAPESSAYQADPFPPDSRPKPA